MSDKVPLSFMWKIENFLYCSYKGLKCLRSAIFYVENLCPSDWYLVVYPNRENQLKILLHNDGFEETNFLIESQCSLSSKEGSVLWAGGRKVVQICFDSKYEIAAYPTVKQVYKNAEYYPHGHILTICCRMWISKEDLSCPILFEASTLITFERRMFHWAVEKFSELRINERKITHQVEIDAGKQIFFMELSLTDAGDNSENVRIDIIQVNNRVSRFLSTCQISVLNTDGTIFKKSDLESYIFDSKKNIWNFQQFLTKGELTTKECNCLENNVLNLLFNLTFTTGEEYSTVECVTSVPPWVQFPEENNPATANFQNSYLSPIARLIHEENQNGTLAILQEDFLSLYKDKTFTDFELRAESASFPVHRSVLATRSPIFKAMFASAMKEDGDNFIDVHDMDGDTLDHFLVFLYTGNVEKLDYSRALKLFYAANEYDVASLKEVCSDFLSDNISENNVCEILELADRHNDELLKSSVHDFIVCNDAKVIRLNEWKKLLETNPKLVAVTMQLVYLKKLDLLAK